MTLVHTYTHYVYVRIALKEVKYVNHSLISEHTTRCNEWFSSRVMAPSVFPLTNKHDCFKAEERMAVIVECT